MAQSQSQQEQQKKRRIGPFELEKKLGVGGMGIVYLATYLKTGQKVALKVLTPSLSAQPNLVKRFEREINILKKLKHPHIVQYYGGGKQGDQRFYAMELMEGGSIERIIKQKKQLDWEQTVDYGRQICAALEYAHNNAIIHRDLKPANLFLAKDGKLKLGDFGIARDVEATALTAAGKTVGTYAYMAPEQITGESPIGPKTDLYALGCVLYEFLTGKPPFLAKTQAEMLYQHVEADPPSVRESVMDCPIWLDSLIQQCMEKEPEDRPYDALAVDTALGEVQEKVAAQTASITQKTMVGTATTVTVDPDDPEVRKILRKKKKKKKKVPVYERGWFLAACLLLLIAGVAWAVWPMGEDELYAHAKELMQVAVAEDDSHIDQWRTAREKYIDPLRERFPESKYNREIQDWIDRIDIDRAERQARLAISLDREPRDLAERLLIDAMKKENDGELLLAMHKYESMQLALEAEKKPENRPYILIAQRKEAEIGSKRTDTDDLRALNNMLCEAEQAFNRGDKNRADEYWRAVDFAFGDRLEYQAEVEYARKRRDGLDVEFIDFCKRLSEMSGEAAEDNIEVEGT